MKTYSIATLGDRLVSRHAVLDFIAALERLLDDSKGDQNAHISGPWYTLGSAGEEKHLRFKDLKPGDKFIFCDAKQTMDEPDVFLRLDLGGCALIETGHVLDIVVDNQLLEREVELKEK